VSTVRRRTPGARAFTRDSFSFLFGWGLTIYQGTIADPFNWAVFVGGLVVVLVPGTAAAWATRQVASWSTTGPPSSDSQPVLPPPSSL
jgi:hypothetical protein